MFGKILIANRGEIACRIARTARRMGIATVAVYSDADARAAHVAACDEALRIGPPPARESYLSIDAILRAARQSGADAIHPGYGFLSENARFADACVAAGTAFIGPPARAIRAMGDKPAAKALMQQAGVPVVPGYHGEDQAGALLKREARRIGFPVLLKAAAGGGGKGMRVVARAQDFEAALEACRREAHAAFGDDRVLLERYIACARHIEMQVFADAHGGCVHLFERDCSVQRRHQKVLEEAPAPGLSEARRGAMAQAAIAAARSVGYVGAGTVEFLAVPEDDGVGDFFFMEMNTRLQVEHPVTEMITGLDLVEWQIRVAAGEPLALAQTAIARAGHAIEARLYAEDPGRDFLPSIGRLIHLSLPAESRHVRVDSGVAQGDEITPWYDPMIAKLVVWDESRARALERLAAALAEVRVVGVASNAAFLANLLGTSSLREARLDTALIEREREALFAAERVPLEVFQIAALALLLDERALAAGRARGSGDPHSPWHAAEGWRLNGASTRTLLLRCASEERTLRVAYGDCHYTLESGGESARAAAERDPGGRLRARIGSRRLEAVVVAEGRTQHVFFRSLAFAVTVEDPLHGRVEHALPNGALVAPMPGRVVAIACAPGTRVEKGTPLLVLEAMKMEHTITAPAAGTLKAHRYAVGDRVALGAQLVDFETDQP